VNGRAAGTGVVHLVRARNGAGPFERFLDSYRANPGGAEHDLVLVFKGFRGDGDLAPYEARLAGLPYRRLLVSDEGFDIGAYFRAAEANEYAYLCFLNSFSVLLDAQWLAKLLTEAQRPGVGVAAATGSWESFVQNAARRGAGRVPVLGAIGGRLRAARLAKSFAPFPNPHVRTNAFVVARRTMLAMSRGPLRRKSEAHRFESGLAGMSAQVLGAGLELVVVGRDGRAYAKDEWPRSRTFRTGEQENLLVSDNQTRAYRDADPAERERLGRLAWGDAWSA
jgi:hypothetical protein